MDWIEEILKSKGMDSQDSHDCTYYTNNGYLSKDLAQAIREGIAERLPKELKDKNTNTVINKKEAKIHNQCLAEVKRALIKEE